MKQTIKIDSSRIEAEEFVAWLNKNGYDAEITNSECDETPDTNALWEKYCDAPIFGYKILLADTNNGVTEYPNDPTNFTTPADEIDFLEPEFFYDRLVDLDDDEEIFCQICSEHPEQKDIYNKIKSEYGIR